MKTKFLFLLLAIVLIIGWAAPTFLVNADDRSVTVKPKQGAVPQMAANAKYYALIIGNNNYKHLPKLKTAIADAKAVERTLREQYGFKTKTLIDATRSDILDGINEMREKVGEGENLLIYYAGHGEYKKEADKAYWLPVDAQRERTTNWIIADDITSNIKLIASRHILIVSDSCYSGTLTRAASTELSTKKDREEFINKMMERPSRTLMASGGNEPVADEGGSGDHSVFASAFLKALKETDKGIFTAEELFHGRVKEIVAGKSEQVPEYNNIKNSGHEGGDFVFMAKSYIPSSLTGEGEGGGDKIKAPEISAPFKEQPFSLEDLEKKRLEKEKQKQIEIAEWDKKTKDMQTAFNKVTNYTSKDISPEDKIEAWKYFKESFSDENPYSEQDDNMRKNADEQIAMAKRPKPYTDPATGMEFVLVKGGCFQMGDTFGDGESDEKPVHEACVDDFYIGKYEVTVGQFRKFVDETGYRTDAEKKNGCFYYTGSKWVQDRSKNWRNSGFSQDDRHPVACVSWDDTIEYTRWMSRKSGKDYRLPTEAEWEYAARSGGKQEKFAGFSNEGELYRYANFCDSNCSLDWKTKDQNDGYSNTSPVGSFKPNDLGLYDMTGNVWEWVQDWYDKSYYKGSPKNNPQGANNGDSRVLRSGSWSVNPDLVRLASRNDNYPNGMDNNCGFRLARTYK